jgi:hypothetical protein
MGGATIASYRIGGAGRIISRSVFASAQRLAVGRVA